MLSCGGMSRCKGSMEGERESDEKLWRKSLTCVRVVWRRDGEAFRIGILKISIQFGDVEKSVLKLFLSNHIFPSLQKILKSKKLSNNLPTYLFSLLKISPL